MNDTTVVDPTDPGHDVEVLREHVRHLERQIRQLHGLLLRTQEKQTPADPDLTFARLLFDAAIKSGHEGVIKLALQLGGVPPCETCGFYKPYCRCLKAAKQTAVNKEEVAEEALEGVEDMPAWIVNDLGELGVRVGNRFFFMYKGGSLEYGNHADLVNSGVALHDNQEPMKYRVIGKYEFGECCYPSAWVKQGHTKPRYTEPLTTTYINSEEVEWQPLPAAPIFRKTV